MALCHPGIRGALWSLVVYKWEMILIMCRKTFGFTSLSCVRLSFPYFSHLFRMIFWMKKMFYFHIHQTPLSHISPTSLKHCLLHKLSDSTTLSLSHYTDGFWIIKGKWRRKWDNINPICRVLLSSKQRTENSTIDTVTLLKNCNSGTANRVTTIA